MKEDSRTEFKEEVSDRIARAAIAFSNSEGGTIYVGIDDEGNIVGVKDADSTSIRCAQLLNDNVRPDITMTSRLNRIDLFGKDVVRIDVSEGPNKPYYLREKGLRAEGVYVRRGIVNIPVSEEMLRVMLQTPRSRRYETILSLNQDLTFDFTRSVFMKYGFELGIEQMRALHIMDGDMYTNLGFMLSDQFDMPVKAAMFQDDYKDTFLDRAEFTGSVLEQFDGVMRFISGHNTKKSVIDDVERKDTTAYPIVAVREAVLNALIHRDYTMQGTILISIYPDRLTISSPGGLNETYSIEDLKTGISSTRNPKLANVFYRLGYVEAYGTGIPRIMKLYRNKEQPTFKVSDALFFVTLPSMLSEKDGLESLLSSSDFITRSDLESLGYSRASAINEINALEEQGRIEKVGGGRSTRYRVL
ncbi:MAG: putative DNA binding domain-containing protein [Candidatus Methanomethylophilaceae archaeon]|nr:putative DNA binding domain-containing protein [Candidatus Methanomethylophilaceae archaeon]